MLTDARKGEIALLVLKQRLRTEGVRLGQNTRREVGNNAKELGIPFAEALEFMEGLARELMEETFANKDDNMGVRVTRL